MSNANKHTRPPRREWKYKLFLTEREEKGENDEREIERERGGERERETDRQTDRQRECQTQNYLLDQAFANKQI